METKLYFGGVPTKPEVDELMRVLEGVNAGELLSYHIIEASMKTGRLSQRGRTIIAAFKRRAYREANKLLIADPSHGYRVADPSERIANSASTMTQGRRKIIRASLVASATDTASLTPEEKRVREHLVSIPAKLRLAELTAPKALS